MSVAFFVASFVHGATGFGAGMTAMAIAPLVLPMLDTVAIVAVFVLLVCLVLAVQLRGSLSNPKVLATLPPLCLGSLIGAPLGVKLLTTTDPRLLKILLGASMLAFVVERLIHEIQLSQSRPSFVELSEGDAEAPRDGDRSGDGRASPGAVSSPKRAMSLSNSSYWGEPVSEVNINRLASFVIGLASGVLTGALNEGGPPVIIYVTLRGWPKDDAKATLQFFFFFSQVVTVAQLALQDVLHTSHLYYDLVGLPAAALGISLGVLVYNTLDQVLFTRVVVTAMLITGVAYITVSLIDIEHNGLNRLSTSQS